jgi:hypothetical protein
MRPQRPCGMQPPAPRAAKGFRHSHGTRYCNAQFDDWFRSSYQAIVIMGNSFAM